MPTVPAIKPAALPAMPAPAAPSAARLAGLAVPAEPLYAVEISLAGKAGRPGFTLKSEYHADPALALAQIKTQMLPEALAMMRVIVDTMNQLP
jgi:hypothetical protein